MIALGAGLAVWNSVALARDVAAATGPHSESQHSFLVAAADRPDIEMFFKGLSHRQRMTMAERIGEYDDPKMADLAGSLLGAFDEEARETLIRSLVRLGKTQPDVVASQIKRPGSVQMQAMTTVLRQLGPGILPAVVHQMTTGGGANAEAYLIATGKPAVSILMPVLDDKDAANRQMAADALGKIGARQAVSKISALYEGAKGEERFAYLSALAGLGAPETEALMTHALVEDLLSNAQKVQVMTGLGKVATPNAARVLWSFARNEDPDVVSGMISALQLAGPVALETAPSDEMGLRVAEGVSGKFADAYVSARLGRAACRMSAARAASGRPGLVSALVAAVHDASEEGEVVDVLMRSLSSTQEGNAALKSLEADPIVGGFAYRRTAMLR